MRKFLVVSVVMAAAALLAVLLVIPAFAQGGDGTTPGGQETWQAMHEACVNADPQVIQSSRRAGFHGLCPWGNACAPEGRRAKLEPV